MTSLGGPLGLPAYLKELLIECVDDIFVSPPAIEDDEKVESCQCIVCMENILLRHAPRWGAARKFSCHLRVKLA